MTKKHNPEKIGIIIPVRHEEKSLKQTITSLNRIVTLPHTIYIADDHIDNTDRTVDIARKIPSAKGKIVIIEKKDDDPDGFGPALLRAANIVREKYIVIVMGDLCDQPETINKMYRVICNGYDVVCGDRYMAGGTKSGGPFIQGMMSYLVNLFIRAVTGIPTHDSSNAFKMYRREIFTGSAGNKIPTGVEASLWFVLNAFFRGAKITSIPTHWQGRTQGKSKFRIFRRTPTYGNIIIWAVINSIKQGREL